MEKHEIVMFAAKLASVFEGSVHKLLTIAINLDSFWSLLVLPY